MNFSSEQGNLSPALVVLLNTQQGSFRGSSGAVIGVVDNAALQMLIPNLLQSFAPGTSRSEKRKFVLVQNLGRDPPCWKGEKSWDNAIKHRVFGPKGVGKPPDLEPEGKGDE